MRRGRPLGLAAAWAGFGVMVAVGIYLPDIDQGLPFLTHRSGLTHSVLPILALWRVLAPALVGGLAVGFAVTLSADLFPAAWTGFATIHLPFAGSIDSYSAPWLAANVVAACAIAHREVAYGDTRRLLVLAYLAVAPLAAAIYSIGHEGKILPLATFLAVWLAVMALAGARAR
ncbi:MAG: hypothetical protein H6842_02090 [Rhodospirillaceae bacterium]|nr:hypothetical protein [Rhodospirillaceae bacterium]